MKIMTLTRVLVVLTLGSVAIGLTPATASARGSQTSLGGAMAPMPSGASAKSLGAGSPTLCLNVLVDGSGWQGWRCSDKGRQITAGAAGSHRKAKAIALTGKRIGTLCVRIKLSPTSTPAQTCVSEGTVLTTGADNGSIRLDTLEVKTGKRTCGSNRVNTAAWAKWQCTGAGGWLRIGKAGANAFGLSV